MPDKSCLSSRTLHDVVKNHRQNPYHPVALSVAVPIIEFLEMVEIGVADGEEIPDCEESLYLRFDRPGTGKPCRRVHSEIPVGAREKRVHSELHGVAVK